MAEVLAVVVLLVLAVNTGVTTRELSAQIDRNALADLAESDPAEVCITGTAEPLSDWYQAEGALKLVPTFKWPNGTTVTDEYFCVQPPPKIKDNSIFGRHNNNRLLDKITLGAMYKCGMIQGHATGAEFVQAIRNNTVAQLASRDVDAGAREDLIYSRRLTIDGQAFDVSHVLDGLKARTKLGPQEPLFNETVLLSELPGIPGVNKEYNTSDPALRWREVLTVTTHFPNPAGRLNDPSLEGYVLRMAYGKPDAHFTFYGDASTEADTVSWMWLTPMPDARMQACMAKHAKTDVERALHDWRC